MNGANGTAILVFVGAAPLVAFVWFAVTYNRLIRCRNHCDEAWSCIDTELQRRHDLIPNLVETVKGYAAHEQGVLGEVTRLREAAETERRATGNDAEAENRLVRVLGPLLLRLEACPELNADENFMRLLKELTLTEDRIQAARRFFNGNVRENNNATQSFPSNLIADWFNFTPRAYYEIEDLRVRDNPSVEFDTRT